MNYDRILAMLPPKIVFDPYWEVLDAIRWVKIKALEFTMDEISDYILNKFEEYNKLDVQKVVKETIAYLVDAGLIEKVNGKFIRTERFDEFVRFLKRGGFRDNISVIVAWAVWYLHNKGLDCFELSQILDVIPNLTKKSVENTLKRLKLEFKGGLWCLNELIVSRILKYARGKISNWWPAFGIFYVKDLKFFKIAHKVSSMIYVDFPIDLIYDYIGELMYLDRSCQNMEEFYEKATELTNYYNRMLHDELEHLFGTNIDWLSFSLLRYLDYYRERKYRIKLNINWRKFLDFIEDYPKNEKIELWKKYRYITNCKHALYPILTESEGKIKDELSNVQEEVKHIAHHDLAEINRAICSLSNYLDLIGKKIRSRLVNVRKAIVGRRRDRIILSFTLRYIPALISTLDALKDLANRGTFPACYREMRKIVENLAWVIFDDILYFRSLITNEYWMFRPYSDIPKEWYDLRSKFANIYDLKQAEDKLKKDYLRGLKQLKYEKDLKDEIVKIILGNLSYLSFIALFSKDASKIDQNFKGLLPILESVNILNIAKSDLQRILNNLNLGKDVVNDILNKLKTSLPSEIIIPFPSNRFVLEFIDYTFSTDLYRFYSEYSFFVHSYFTSWHVMPFSSILEIKIFRHELSKFSNEIQKLFKNYVNSLNRVAKVISKS